MISFWFVWVIYFKYWKRPKPSVYPEKHQNGLVWIPSKFMKAESHYTTEGWWSTVKNLYLLPKLSCLSLTLRETYLKRSNPTVKLVPTFDHSSEGLLRSFGFRNWKLFGKTDWYLITQLPFVRTDPFHPFTASNSKCYLIAQHFLIQMIGSKGQGSKILSGIHG